MGAGRSFVLYNSNIQCGKKLNTKVWTYMYFLNILEYLYLFSVTLQSEVSLLLYLSLPDNSN